MENSDFKISEKHMRGFQDFRVFSVFDLDLVIKFPADLVTLTEENFHGKFHFFVQCTIVDCRSVIGLALPYY